MLDFLLKRLEKGKEKPKTTMEAIRSLGYVIDDGDIIFEVPNKFPFKTGHYQGEEQGPLIIYDFSCRDQVLAANRLKKGLRDLGYQVELSSKTSYGQLSRQVAETQDLFVRIEDDAA